MNNQTSSALTTEQKREVIIKDGLLAQQKMINSLLADKGRAKKFLATAVKIATDYKLAECHPQSIIDACILVAQLDLDLSPVLAHAYLVPYKNDRSGHSFAQLNVSAKGYGVQLERQGWKIKSYIVSEDDTFSYVLDGFDVKIIYERNLDGDTKKFKYAVALAKAPDGTLYVEVMNKAQIEEHRLSSPSQKSGTLSGVWKNWYNAMALKTVTKKLAKTLPLEGKVAETIHADDKPIEVEIIEKQEDKKKSLNSLNEST